MGIGGLHSQEAHRALYSDDRRVLIDVDVAGHYPNIIAGLGIYPKAMGPAFIDIYRRMIAQRLEAKRQEDRAKADGLKIANNGVFGKLGSSYSPLYSPSLMIATTLTGQLSVLMLIERAEAIGIPVVSANTDGVVFHCPRADEDKLSALVAGWEAETGFEIERTRYRSLHSSSVNTYVAIREDGKVKSKGPVADPWQDGDLRVQMSKNPQMTVCSRAVVAFLRDAKPIEESVRACADPRAFVTVIKVASGGVWRGYRLGRAVRYYWSVDGDPILYADGSRKVPKTDGARPLPELTDAIPVDLDYPRYVEEAWKIAADLGVDVMTIRQ
jgi:hypothetical protein